MAGQQSDFRHAMIPASGDVMLHVSKEILWDYVEPPEDLLWRLQRIADFFPTYGRDRETVELLYRYGDQLKLDDATRTLIEAYRRAWNGES